MSWRQLATPGSSAEILARFLQINPMHRRAEALTGISQSAEPIHGIGDRKTAHPGPAGHLTETLIRTILWLDTDAVRAAGSRRENL